MYNVEDILARVFASNVSTFKDVEIQNQIGQFIKEVIKPQDKDGSLNIGVYVKDVKKKHWKPDDHFVKVYDIEIKYAQQEHGLTKVETGFLYMLMPYLKWEMNLLVDEEDKPMNQTKLSSELEMDRKTVRKHLNSLIEKKIVYEVLVGKALFYFVNPFLMFRGRDINIAIIELFETIGYVNDSRNNRRKSVAKRNKIKGL